MEVCLHALVICFASARLTTSGGCGSGATLQARPFDSAQVRPMAPRSACHFAALLRQRGSLSAKSRTRRGRMDVSPHAGHGGLLVVLYHGIRPPPQHPAPPAPHRHVHPVYASGPRSRTELREEVLRLEGQASGRTQVDFFQDWRSTHRLTRCLTRRPSPSHML